MPRPSTIPFGIQLGKWRRERDLSEAELAKLLGVHPRAIPRLELTMSDTDETKDLEVKLKALQLWAGEPVTPTAEQVRDCWQEIKERQQ